ncbi:MAG: hypothetical protein IKS41_02625 [Alphaproteobacteria bacterium]|nr:hypothetical protein [Alphaproteobacteria bacterium]
MYSVYQLAPEEQQRLLKEFPPRYSKVYADHVTVQFGGANVALPKPADQMEIIGRADDNHGLEALVVRINGNLKREDGKIYHITWSLNPDIAPSPEIDSQSPRYKPVHSNALVCNLIDTEGNRLPGPDIGWSFFKYDRPIPFRAEPKVKYTSAELAKKRQYTL